MLIQGVLGTFQFKDVSKVFQRNRRCAEGFQGVSRGINDVADSFQLVLGFSRLLMGAKRPETL